jgi:hypothetical protein
MSRKTRIIWKKCENCGEMFKKEKHYTVDRFLNEIRFCSYKCRGEYLKGDKHHNWKGEEVNIVSKHIWLINNYGSANHCENRDNKIFDFECNCKSNKYAYALKHECGYKKNIDNFYQLCYSCHKKYDLQKGWKGSSTSYKKGNVPFTKGKKRPEITGKKHPLYGTHQSLESLVKFRETLRLKKLKKYVITPYSISTI